MHNLISHDVQSNFTIIEHLTPEARKHLEIFVKSSRKLLQQHNIGIYEKKK